MDNIVEVAEQILEEQYWSAYFSWLDKLPLELRYYMEELRFMLEHYNLSIADLGDTDKLIRTLPLYAYDWLQQACDEANILLDEHQKSKEQ